MKLRKQGTCGECGKPLYGDEYGAAGHACEKYESREEKLLRLLKEAYTNGTSSRGRAWDEEVKQILNEEKK